METLQRTANRGSVSTGYEIDNSLKIEADNAERIYRASGDIGTPTSTQKATISAWVKRTELQSSGNGIVWIGNAGGVSTILGFNNDRFHASTSISGGFNLSSTPVFRDTSAWYHIVWAFDTTQGTAANRVKLYVNGVQIENFDTATYPNQNNAIGLYETNMGHYFGWSDAQSQSGYYAEAYLIDGQQLAPTEFGEFDSDTGIWIPKAYTGSFGNEGYYLDFEDSSNLGLDVSGNSNNFGSLYGISAADQATDTPTNNFCTWNVNYNYTNSNGNPTITEGATKTAESSGGWTQAKATMGVTSGKWYWEYKMGGSISFMGVQDDTASQSAFSGQYSLFLYNGDNTVEINDTGSNRDDTTLSYTFSTSNIYAVALNMDDNEISYYQNGSIIGSAISLDGLADRLLLPYIGTNSSTNETNFGGYTTISISSAASDANGYGTFEYAPPSGYYAICTKNLAEYG